MRRGPASVAGGLEQMRELLTGDRLPTGVFCTNDLIALGALKACLTAGVEVPRQISLVGCDDIEMARVVTPELTTVMVPARGIGARAVRLLLQQLDGGATRATSTRPLPVQLVVRGTSGSPEAITR